MQKIIISFSLKLISIIASSVGIILSFYWPTGYMVRWRTFLYFTTMANVFMAITQTIEIVIEIIELTQHKIIQRKTLYAFKHIFTIAMVITIVTFYIMSFGGLIEGGHDNSGIVALMLQPSNWTVHLIAPICSILDYLFIDEHIDRDNYKLVSLCTMVFPIAYAIGTIILSLNGVLFGGEGQVAPYFFLDYKTYGLWIIAMDIVLGIIVYALSYLFLKMKSKIKVLS